MRTDDHRETIDDIERDGRSGSGGLVAALLNPQSPSERREAGTESLKEMSALEVREGDHGVKHLFTDRR